MPEPLEQIAAEDRLFTEPGPDDDGVEDVREGGGIARDVVVRRVDRRRAKQRHDDGLHDELEERAEQEADRDAPEPALRPHEADCGPRSL